MATFDINKSVDQTKPSFSMGHWYQVKFKSSSTLSMLSQAKFLLIKYVYQAAWFSQYYCVAFTTINYETKKNYNISGFLLWNVISNERG